MAEAELRVAAEWLAAEGEEAQTVVVDVERTDEDEVRLGLEAGGTLYLSTAAAQEVGRQLRLRGGEAWSGPRGR